MAFRREIGGPRPSRGRLLPPEGEPDFETGFAGAGFEFNFTAMPGPTMHGFALRSTTYAPGVFMNLIAMKRRSWKLWRLSLATRSCSCKSDADAIRLCHLLTRTELKRNDIHIADRLLDANRNETAVELPP